MTPDAGAGPHVGVVGRAWRWLQRPQEQAGLSSPLVRRLGLAWVGLSVAVTTAASFLVGSEDAYIWVLVVLGFGPFCLPALFVGRQAVRYAPPDDRVSYELLHAGLVATVAIGVGMAVALSTGWDVLLMSFPPLAGLAGALHIAGLAMLVRRRSGHRALSVDIIEAVASVVAVTAPLAVLWWPAVVEAEAAWFTVGCSVLLLFTVAGMYWVCLLWVRLGPGPRGIFEASAVAAAFVGSAAAALQVAQGVSGFTLPAPPIMALTALSASTYLLITLHVPLLVRHGLDGLPPEAQVRGSWLPTVVPLAGLAALLGATAAVAGSRSWAVPFSLAVVSVLAVLGGMRQMAALRETRHLYRQVEQAAGKRRKLLTQLLERSVADRRRVAQQLHQQAISAYASFAALAGASGPDRMLITASEHVRDDLERHAESLHELVLSIRPLDGDSGGGHRLAAPIGAYLDTIYGDRVAPHLEVRMSDDLALDWVVETVLMQIVQEALHNVWRHSEAGNVAIAVEPVGRAVAVAISDDGVGFDPPSVPEGAGLPAMRSSAGVVDGSFEVASTPGGGTTVRARLGPAGPPERPPPAAGARPGAGGGGAARRLRLVPDPPGNGT